MRLLALCLLVTPAFAQVSTDSKALDQLAPTAKPTAPSPAHHARRVVVPKKPLKAVAMPAAPPVNPVIQPPAFAMPVHKPAPPPPVPVKPDAAGAATPLPHGTRITFAAGGADLNPATFATLQALAAKGVGNPALIIDITAWAPGPADDPSTARRLSLDRALAARAVLISGGMVSEHIRVVARGFSDIGQGPADRLDAVEEVLPAK